MVMWFNVEKAREYLLNEGRVYTLRPKRRKREECLEVLSYGGFGKKGIIYVSFVKQIENNSELKEFVENSGFRNIKEWKLKAKDSRFLYYVILLDEREN